MIIECNPTFQSNDCYLSHYGIKGMRWGHRKRKYDRMLQKNTKHRRNVLSKATEYVNEKTDWYSTKQKIDNINKRLESDIDNNQKHRQSDIRSITSAVHHQKEIINKVNSLFKDDLRKATLEDIGYKKDYKSGIDLLKKYDLDIPLSDLYI